MRVIITEVTLQVAKSTGGRLNCLGNGTDDEELLVSCEYLHSLDYRGCSSLGDETALVMILLDILL